MPGISIVAVLKANRSRHSNEKIHRRNLRDASDPLAYSNAVFISDYRLNKEAFIMVLNKVSPLLKRSTIPAIIQLAVALRFLATGAFQGVIAKDVDISMGRSTISTLMWRVLNEIENVICPEWIKFLMTPESIVGCIDGTHIKLTKPTEDESIFLNRKGTFSVNAMIICDYNMKVLAVDASRPGSCHDSFIWHMSSARTYYLNEYLNGDQNSWLLGDSGYGLEPFLMTPYKEALAGTIEHQFNKKHTSGRNIVERTIGVIKSRFRCLLGTLIYSHQKVVTIINVYVALHNICREFNIDCEEDLTCNADNSNDEAIDDELEEISQRNMYNIAKRIRDSIAAGLV